MRIPHADREARPDPCDVLGVSAEANEKEIRSAYLEKVKAHPPDHDPAEFERIRDAYEILRDPRRRTEHLLLEADPYAPIASLLDEWPLERNFVGPLPWLEILKERP
jgi:curved DNA-binding protein CbpA